MVKKTAAQPYTQCSKEGENKAPGLEERSHALPGE